MQRHHRKMETQREDKPAEAEGEAGCCCEHRTLCAGLSSLARVWQSELLVKLPLLDPPISWSGPLVPLGQEAGLSVMLPPPPAPFSFRYLPHAGPGRQARMSRRPRVPWSSHGCVSGRYRLRTSNLKIPKSEVLQIVTLLDMIEKSLI